MGKMGLNIILIWNYFFATMVILSRNSLYSIINFILLILGSCLLLFYLEIEFLSFILMLIYIGAIVVLFLFIIMMFQLNKEEIKTRYIFNISSKYLFYFILCIKVIISFIYFNKELIIILNNFSCEFNLYNDDLNIFYNTLFKLHNDIYIYLTIFNQYYFYFILLGIILLFSMIGSISLCLRKN